MGFAPVFVAWCMLFVPVRSLTLARDAQTDNPAAQRQPEKPGASPPAEPATQAPEKHPGEQPTPPSKNPFSSGNPKSEAWQTLETACAGDKTADRADATRALGLIRNEMKAQKLAERGLDDPKPEVRVAAAAALGEMRSRRSIPRLKKALEDDDPAVAVAAAHSLILLHENSAYEVYYEILTKERNGGKGLLSSQMSRLSDPKKMAELGFEEGIGFIPFAGIGWRAIKEIRKDDSSPVRAAAAQVLVADPDPDVTKALVEAAGDASWLVRAAALEALAKRDDPSVLDTVELYIVDEKDVVRYTACAATLRLLGIQHTRRQLQGKSRASEKGNSTQK
jgi:HEAT repeat protein